MSTTPNHRPIGLSMDHMRLRLMASLSCGTGLTGEEGQSAMPDVHRTAALGVAALLYPTPHNPPGQPAQRACGRSAAC